MFLSTFSNSKNESFDLHSLRSLLTSFFVKNIHLEKRASKPLFLSVSLLIHIDNEILRHLVNQYKITD